MKRVLLIKKGVFALLLALSLGVGTVYAYDFYDFSAVCSTGQTLYYNIINATNHYVEITHPGTSIITPWDGYTQPTGSITLPSAVTNNNNGVTYTVTKIGDHAFDGCNGLTGSLTIPNSVTTIGRYAFYNCHGFTGSLTIGNSVTTIGGFAFDRCSGLTGSLTLPNSLTMIDDFTFSDCGFTGSLTIPNSVTSIGDGAFHECRGFEGSLNIGNSVTSIGEMAFEGCYGFTGSLTIPNSVTTIDEAAFNGCNYLSSLIIGNGVTSIGKWAFGACYNLTSVTVFPETPPTLGIDVFYYVPTTIPVYVPCASLEDYQAASGWSAFTNMQCIPELTVYEGTSTNRNVPAYIYYFDNFTRSQFVIPAEDLVEMIGTPISSMTFYTTSSNVPYTTTCSADVYLKQVDYTTISAYEPKSSATIVYSGTFSIASTENGGEMTINFSTPYTYHGNDLLVGIENTETGGWKDIYFYGQTVSGASISGNTSSSTGTIPANQQNFIPKTTFGFAPTYFAKNLPYTYGFEEEDEMECWTVLNGSIHTGRNYNTSYSHEGDYGFRFSYYEAPPPQYLISPKLECPWGVDVSFYYKNASDYYPETFQVGYSTTTKSPSAYIWSDQVTANHQDTWMLYGETFPEGTKYVAVRYNSDDMDRLYIDDFSFEFPSCPRPIDLTATDITANSATLQWAGYQDSYDLRYRKKVYFYEDFENGLPSDWTTIDNDGDGYNWHSVNYSSSFCHSGSTIMASASYDNDNSTVLTPDNWLITPQLELQGAMKVWIRALHPNYAQEHFAIYLSTTGNSVSDFTTVLVPETTLTDVVYRAYTADLSAYEGQQGYIAIRHFNCSDMYEILLDDFGLFDDPNETGEWETLYEVGSSYTLTTLEPITEYEWQVRGRDCDGEGTYSEWSSVHNFTTLLCAPEDQCELTFTLTDSYGDGWNGAAIRVVDVETNTLIALMSAQHHGGFNMPSTDTLTLAVCDGRELRFEWMSGSYDSECSYIVTDINGNEVFSGYGAMSASFTYMVNCIPVQTVALSSGPNWFSTYLEITKEDLQNALLDALSNPTGAIIKSQDGNSTYRGGRWRDQNFVWDVAKMYRIVAPEDCVITLTGMPIDPADHPITIAPNTPTWIGFPFAESKTPVEAIPAGFAVNGDIIKGIEGNARYTNGSWRAQGISRLEPGQGYIYQSASSTPRVLSFAQHDYVDLGLPSGLLWATCNVGADSPEDYGDYFAWGETTPKDTYDWSTYQYGDGDTFTKYTGSDGLTTLLPEDDAATANWGSGWRMPTEEEWEELLDNTTVTWTTQNGVNGRLFTATNGNSLFLPAAGARWDGELGNVGSGNYWSSSLDMVYSDNSDNALGFGFESGGYIVGYAGRYYGFTVRPVRSAQN